MPNPPLRASALRASRRRGAQRPDSGFTMIELILAMVIVSIVMMAMLGLYVGSLETTVVAKQRQSASAIATQNLERLRALPYDVIRAGLATSDLTGDPSISSTSPAPRLQMNGIDEVLVTSTTQNKQPLFPHRRVETVDGVAYTVAVYVTQGTTPTPTYQLTSVVSWAQAGNGADKQVVQRSTAFSAAGCLSLANRPFSGPCQASFSALSGVTAGSISVTNDSDSTAVIPGTNGSLLALDLAGLSTNSAVEQTVTVSATSRAMGARSRTTTGETKSGGNTWSSNADTDPSSANNTLTLNGSVVTAAPAASALSVTGTAGTFTAVPSAALQAVANSATAGTTASCTSVSGTSMNSEQPCATASIRHAATPASLTFAATAPSFLTGGLGAMNLASVDTTSTGSRSVAGRLVGSLGGYCPGTVGDGCAYAETARTLGTVSLGGLPPTSRTTDRLPTGLTSGQPLVEVTGFTESARTESGSGARVPQFSRAGTLRYYNGAAYTTVNLSTVPAAGDEYVLPEAVATYSDTAGTAPYVTVTARAVVRVGAVTTSQSPLPPLPCNATSGACRASSTSSAALSGQVQYVLRSFATATDTGTELTRFVVVSDLGTVNATSYYQAAPPS